MTAITQSFAQSGSSCATSKFIGIGASYSATQTVHNPSSELWLKYVNPSSAIRFNMIPSSTGGSNSFKFKEVSIYLDSCGGKQMFTQTFDTTQVIPLNLLLNKIPVYSNVYIYIKRYAKAGCGGCDTAYRSFSLSVTSNNNLLANVGCTPSACSNNLIENGNFEEYSNLIDLNTDWNNEICGWNSILNYPDYYNTDNTTFTDVDIPGSGTGYPPGTNKYYIDVPPTNYWYTGAASNTAVVGLSLDDNSNDVITGNISSDLIATKQYYLSFDATNSGRPNYAGRLDIDLSDQSVYDPSSSDYNIVDLQFSGNVGTFKAIWQNFETVITSSGDESYVHIGNLQPTVNNSVTPQTAYVVGTDQEYIFIDNIALVPLAYAGNDVSLCPTATAQLGACPIPGASYTWSPTTGLDDPYIANPTATGTGSTITYTVYVTLTIGGTTYTDNDQVIVTAGGTSVSLAASPLVLTSAGTTVLTASPAGAGTYAFYNMASPGTILQNTSSNTFTTGTLSATTTYGVTLTDANGCTAQFSVEILYTTTPCNSGSPLTHISSNSSTQLTAGPYIGEAFDVSNGFTFNSDVSFTNCEFWIRDGATVNINTTRTVTMMGGLVRQCDKMWDRIINKGTIKADGTTFTQGDMAVVMYSGSNNVFRDCFFNDNVYGINTLTTTPQKTINLEVTGTTFQHLSGFVTAYTGQPTHYTLPAAGIQLTNCTNTTIGDDAENPNIFTDLYTGIISNTTNTLITNSFFRDFAITSPTGSTPPSPGSGLAHPYNRSGVGILGMQTQNSGTAYTITVNPAIGQVITTDPTISGAGYKGILTIGVGLEANGLILEDCFVGIQNESLNAINHVEIFNCDIITSFHGINWLGNLTLSNLLAQGNTIEVSNTTFFNGNGVQVSNNGAQTPNSGIFAFPQIVDNNITLTNIGKGIRINNSSQTVASENTIHKNFTGSQFIGIEVSASDSLVINNNELTTSTGYTTSGNSSSNNVGIKVSASNDLTIACNSTAGHYYGITFTGDCDGTGANFRTNQIGSHFYGLYYQATALVGPSLYNGNRWVTTSPSPNAFHARNDNAVFNVTPICLTNDNSQYLLNEIRTSGTGDVTTTSFPVTANNRTIANPCAAGTFVLDNTGWINNFSGTADAVCTDPIGSNLMAMEEMEMRAIGMAGASEFNEEIKQSAEEHLYESLQLNTALLTESEILESFYNDKEGTTLEKQWLVKKLIAEGINNTYLTGLKTNSIQINTIQQTLHELLKNHGDSISVRNTKMQLTYYQDIQEGLSSSYKSTLISKRLLATLANNSIDAGNVMDYNTKEITAIYLSKFYGKDTVDFHNDSAAIYAIAKQCPLAGGNAVYWARAMYESLVPNVTYYDDSVCVQIVEERRGNALYVPANSETKSANTGVYPNPSEGLFTVFAVNTTIKYVELFDLIGNKLTEQSILKSQAEMNYSTFGKGSYILKVTDEFNQVAYHKIIIK